MQKIHIYADVDAKDNLPGWDGSIVKVGLMSDVSPEWRGLIESWEQITAAFHAEMKSGKSAPNTYAYMRAALEAVHAQ